MFVGSGKNRCGGWGTDRMMEGFVPHLDSEVRLSPRTIGGQSGAIAHHQGLEKFFRFGCEEALLIGMIDGRRSVEDLLLGMQRAGVDWSGDDVVGFLSMLIRERLLLPPVQEFDQEKAEQLGRKTDPLRWWMTPLSSVVSLRIPLMDFDRPALRLSRHFGFLFQPVAVAVWAVLVISAMVMMALRRDELAGELSRLFDRQMWIPMLGIWLLCKMLHEAGHAVAAKRQGVRIGKTGVMFFLMAPLAYVDVTASWMLPRRMSRMAIALAGVYVELAVASVAAWCWWCLPDGLVRHIAAQVFVVAGPATLLVNANPLLRLDGYYVLSDLVDIPNLRSHGRRQLAGWLEYVLLAVPRESSLLSGWRVPFATGHAMASVVFQFVWMAGLVFAVSYWAKGLGILVAVVAVLLWAAIPLGNWMLRHVRDGDWRRRYRLGLSVVLIVPFGQWLWNQRSPITRRVPVVVRYHDELIARAPSDAFVVGVFVEGGQRVKSGSLLMRLQNDELQVRHDQTADRLDLAMRREVQLRRQGKLADAEIEKRQAENLKHQLEDLRRRLDELQVTAQRDGMVTTSNPIDLLGEFVTEGTELVRVSDAHEKELLASIGESDAPAYRRAVQSAQPVRVRLRGGVGITALPVSLRPRADVQLPHPALSAAIGGPLPVQPDPESGENRLIAPRFTATSPIEPVAAASVRAGQQGTMVISDDRTIGQRIWERLDPQSMR
ncbi:Peptidase family M50 [Crateriforma conspicua]|uniref:Peptidase family M50 n=2 Tax=Crateriforma conspicua TaxID=2527996 RepID=A0A5C6G230_9PLAN|nr:Peptidase family M50 [Crateriforma conspicua]